MRLPLMLFLIAAMSPAFAAEDLATQLHAQVARCWNPPARATGSVTVHMQLRPDGSIAGMPTVNGLASAGVAKAALHAATFCAPYHLPQDHYTDWARASVTLATSGK